MFQLFDGTFAPEASVGRLCGVLSPATIVTRNILFVHFNSDDSLNVVRGFEASFQHVPGIVVKICYVYL